MPKPTAAPTPHPEHHLDDLRDFLDKHGTKVLVALLVVLVGLVGWNILRIRNLQRAEAAGLAFLMAETPADLRALIENYPATADGRYALLDLGRRHAGDESYEDAAKAFTEFLDRFPEDLMAPVASLGLALTEEGRKQFAQAETRFKAVAQSGPDWLRGPAILGWGRVIEQSGKWDEARVVYEDGSAQLPEAWAPSIESSLQRVLLEMRRPASPTADPAEPPTGSPEPPVADPAEIPPSEPPPPVPPANGVPE